MSTISPYAKCSVRSKQYRLPSFALAGNIEKIERKMSHSTIPSNQSEKNFEFYRNWIY